MSLNRIALALLAPLALALLSSCYVTTQGGRYLGLQAKAVSLERLMADPATEPEIRELLVRAAEVRAFARDALGLAESRNFTTLVRLERDYLADVVSACAPLSFERKLWKYPVVGALPYKGFFKRAEAEAEAAKLRAKGWDVLVREVDAFSTLGWFKDPLWSFMASYGPGSLAEILVHELAHATVFVKGREGFNEALATFVGVEGAKAWLGANYGGSSPELAAYLAAKADGRRFAAFLAETARKLEVLYGSGIDEESMRGRKAALIAERAVEYERDAAAYSLEAYRSYPMDAVDNALLDLYRLYEPDSGFWSACLERVAAGSLRQLVEYAREAAEEAKRTKRDPETILRDRLAAAAP